MLDGQTILTQSEVERLVILNEECAEVQQIISKILRHGYGSYNPFDEKKTPNRELLNMELGHLQFAHSLMIECDDINQNTINAHTDDKRASIQKYLHHNTPQQTIDKTNSVK